MAFENRFDHVCEVQGWYPLTIPSGAKWTRKGMYATKSPFDRIVSKLGFMPGFFDLKALQSGNFSFTMIDQNQLNKLFNLHRAGQTAGYIIHFKDANMVSFYDAEFLRQISPKQSFSCIQGVELGSICDFRVDAAFKNARFHSIPAKAQSFNPVSPT